MGKSIITDMNLKYFALLGIAGAFFMLFYMTPQEMVQVSVQSALDDASDEIVSAVDEEIEVDGDVRAGILPYKITYPTVVRDYLDELTDMVDVGTFSLVVEGELEGQMEDLISGAFPRADIELVVLEEGMSKKELDAVADDLKGFVLGITDFSHYLPKGVADFHNELSRTVIESFDFWQLDEVEVGSWQTLYVVMKYAEEVEAQNVEIVDHTNSASGDDFEDSVSSFYILFKEGEVAADRAITVMAFGDMMMGRYVRTLMDREDNASRSFDRIRGKENRFFYGADTFFANLEGPIKGEGYRSGTSVIFGFHEDTAPLLKKFGFDVLSLANNHILNQGWDGLDSTYGSLHDSGISSCGHPTEIERSKVTHRYFADKHYAFICFDDVAHNLDQDEAVALISEIDEDTDHTIVSIHWGVEYAHTPHKSLQVEPGHAFVDAGADVVIGHHPHVVQTFEIYNGAPIFYSLGNFIFDQYWSYDTEEQLGIGLVLGAESEDGNPATRIYLFPMHSDKSQPYLMNEEEQERFYDRLINWGGYDDEMAAQIRSGVIEIGL